MFYSNPYFIKAHQNRSIRYYNNGYDREVRDAICSNCGAVIGEQQKYEIENQFHFIENEKENYTHCPYCGHEFKTEMRK